MRVQISSDTLHPNKGNNMEQLYRVGLNYMINMEEDDHVTVIAKGTSPETAHARAVELAHKAGHHKQDLWEGPRNWENCSIKPVTDPITPHTLNKWCKFCENWRDSGTDAYFGECKAHDKKVECYYTCDLFLYSEEASKYHTKEKERTDNYKPPTEENVK